MQGTNKNSILKGFKSNIDKDKWKTRISEKVPYTGKDLQLVVMRLKDGIVCATKEVAEKKEEHFNGKTTEAPKEVTAN